MALITLIIGFLAGTIAGMILAAGSWRRALGKVGDYATKLAETPVGKAAPQESKPLAPPSGS